MIDSSVTPLGFIIFSNRTDIWWLRGLHRNFKHCFILFPHKNGAIVINPLLHRTEVQIYENYDLIGLIHHFASHGHIIVPSRIKRCQTSIIPRVSPYSCVESVRRMAGISGKKLFTPRQLYNRTIKNMKKNIDRS